jgi:hypothetical protein
MDDQQKNGINSGVVEEGGSNGLMVGVVLIIILIILGGLYFWNQRMNGGDMPYTTDTSAVTDITKQSSSDASDSIEDDLTDVEDIDTPLNAS